MTFGPRPPAKLTRAQKAEARARQQRRSDARARTEANQAQQEALLAPHVASTVVRSLDEHRARHEVADG